jgi:hypothetical protein
VLAAASLSLSISRLQRAARESGAARDWARAVDIFRTRRSAAGAFPRPSRTHENEGDPQSAASHGRTLTPAGQITESDAAKWAPGAPLASAHSVSSPPGAAARQRPSSRARSPPARPPGPGAATGSARRCTRIFRPPIIACFAFWGFIFLWVFIRALDVPSRGMELVDFATVTVKVSKVGMKMDPSYLS